MIQNAGYFILEIFLFSSGFGEVWLNQGVGHENVFLKVFKQRLIDMDMQALNMDINFFFFTI